MRSNHFRTHIAMFEITTRAILFDLDGVLMDSRECVERTWRDWARRHELDADHVVHAAHGRRTIETVALVAPHLLATDEVAALAESESQESRGVYPIPGVALLLRALPSTRWAIVTSGMRRVAEFRLHLGELPTPAVLIAAEDVTRGKPDPEGYLRAAQALGVVARDCIVVEDAPAGIQAARAAGMRAIGVLGTYPREALADSIAVIASVATLQLRVTPDHLGISFDASDA